MIVRYDSYVLKKCMKPAGNFLCVRGGRGCGADMCAYLFRVTNIHTYLHRIPSRRCDAALGKRTVCDIGWKWMYGTIENKL